MRSGRALFAIDAALYRANLAKPRRPAWHFESAGCNRLLRRPIASSRWSEANAINNRTTLTRRRSSALHWSRCRSRQVATTTPTHQPGLRRDCPDLRSSDPCFGRRGALVEQAKQHQLAVVQQINPMYVNFTQSAADVMATPAQWRLGQLEKRNARGPTPRNIELVLGDSSIYAKPGKLLFSITVEKRDDRPDRCARQYSPGGFCRGSMFASVSMAGRRGRRRCNDCAAAGGHQPAIRATA